MLVKFAVLLVCVGCCHGNQFNDADVADLMKRLSTLVKKVELNEKILAAQRDELNNLEKTPLQDIQSETVSDARRFVLDSEGPVAFSSVISPNVIDHMHAQDALKFDKVLTNIGGGYMNDTGIFTVPISGIYLFSSSILDHMLGTGSHGGVEIHADIVQNSIVLARIYAHAVQGYRDQGAQTVIVHANAGDQVWIRLKTDNIGVGGKSYTSFSGYLLWPMP